MPRSNARASTRASCASSSTRARRRGCTDLLRARAAGRVGHDPARPAGGDGPERSPGCCCPRSPARPTCTRPTRSSRCVEIELGIAGRFDDALPDPRERGRDPQRVRDRDGLAIASRTWAARCHASATSSPTSASVGRARGTETLFIREKVLIDARAAGIRYPISGMWGGANDDLDGLRDVADRAARHRLLRDDDGQRGARADRQRGVHADVRRGRVLAGARPADVGKPRPPTNACIYGDANQGEGHEVHIAHVATARKLLAWARELGVA